jgi:hypothetical protein
LTYSSRLRKRLIVTAICKLFWRPRRMIAASECPARSLSARSVLRSLYEGDVAVPTATRVLEGLCMLGENFAAARYQRDLSNDRTGAIVETSIFRRSRPRLLGPHTDSMRGHSSDERRAWSQRPNRRECMPTAEPPWAGSCTYPKYLSLE